MGGGVAVDCRPTPMAPRGRLGEIPYGVARVRERYFRFGTHLTSTGSESYVVSNRLQHSKEERCRKINLLLFSETCFPNGFKLFADCENEID